MHSEDMAKKRNRMLIVGGDKDILQTTSDARTRMLDYGPLLEELYIHIAVGSAAIEKTQVLQLGENIFVHVISEQNIVKRWLRSIAYCARLIRQKHIDVVSSPDPYVKGWVSASLAFFLRTKLLIIIFGSNIFLPDWYKQSFGHRLYPYLGRLLFWYADAIQTDGVGTARQLTTMFGKKVFYKALVPKHSQVLQTISRTQLPSQAKTRVLYVARFVQQKNIPMLVRVIRSVHDSKQGREFVFTIVGNGPLREHFVTELKDLIDTGYVTYIEGVDVPGLLALYPVHDVLVLTSLYEGFPRVFMEAAASHMPIVTTEVSGTEKLIVNGESGYIVPQNDVAKFTQALIDLGTNKEKLFAFGARARSLFNETFSYTSMLEQQKSVFDYLASL